jgi:O-antigen ligase
VTQPIATSDPSAVRVATFIILAITLTLPVDQLFSIQLGGGVVLTVQTIALLCSGAAVVIGLLVRPVVRVQVAVLLMPAIAWFWLAAIRSVDISRAVTYLILLSLCGAAYLQLSAHDLRGILGRINRLIYVIGATITLVCLARYGYVITHDAARILSNPQLWDVGSADVYEVQFGGIIAYQGFGGDPNAVGVATAIILFCGLSLRFRRRDWLRHVVNVMLVAAIFASNSRGAIAALAVALLVGALMGSPDYRKYLAAFATAGGALLVVVLRNLDWVSGLANPLEKLQRGSTRRFQEWSQVLDAFAEKPMLGDGLRYSEALLGKYTENSYLTLLADTGLLGLLMYGTIMLVPAALLLSRRRHLDARLIAPWFVYAAFLLVSMLYISMEVKPVVWVTFGILASVALARQSQSGDCRARSLGAEA